jgi:hypothetical protein
MGDIITIDARTLGVEQILPSLKKYLGGDNNPGQFIFTNLTFAHIEILLAYVAAEKATIPITLEGLLPPVSKEQSEQLETARLKIDNLISDNIRARAIESLVVSSPQEQEKTKEKTSKTARAHLPRSPKIAINYCDAPASIEPIHVTTPALETAPEASPMSGAPNQFKTAAIPACVVEELIKLPQYEAEKAKWSAIKTPQAALEFRKTDFFPSKLDDLNDHPLCRLWAVKNPDLLGKLKAWGEKLNWGIEQHHAVLSLYAQYGEEGCSKLFARWDKYEESQIEVFQKTNAIFAQDWQSYSPFIANPKMQEMIDELAGMSKEERSWWYALLVNHQTSKKDPKDLLVLYQRFKEFSTKVRKEFGLTFTEIEAITEARSLPETLDHMTALLERCGRENRQDQWREIHKVKYFLQEGYSFIIDEMDLEEASPTGNAEIEEMQKYFLQINTGKDARIVIAADRYVPAVYRYLASQACCLPISVYRKIFADMNKGPEALGQHPEHGLEDRTRFALAYILARSTGGSDRDAFNSEQIMREWSGFFKRIAELATLAKIKENTLQTFGGSAKVAALNALLERFGGASATRCEILEPLIKMESIPLLSILNALLNAAEYQFFGAGVGMTELEKKQKILKKVLDLAAMLYKENKVLTINSIRFLKTDELQKVDKVYQPDKNDELLIQAYVSAAWYLTHDTDIAGEEVDAQPKEVLFPLLTTFHLEYQVKFKEEFTEENTEQIIQGRRPESINFGNIPVIVRNYSSHIKQLPKESNERAIYLYAFKLLRYIINAKDLKSADLLQFQAMLFSKIKDGGLSNNKAVREWLRGGVLKECFVGSDILVTNDAVNIDGLLAEFGYAQKDDAIAIAIAKLVAPFDAEEEKDHYKALVQSLHGLVQRLGKAQSLRCFSLFEKQFQAGNLFDRVHHSNDNPTWMRQFINLVDCVHDGEALEKLEHYVKFVLEQDREKNKKKKEEEPTLVAQSSLSKCTYLLDSLYPSLIGQGMVPKEAFTLSVDLVYETPIDEMLKPRHVGAHFIEESAVTKHLNELKPLQIILEKLVKGLPDKPLSIYELQTIKDNLTVFNTKYNLSEGVLFPKISRVFEEITKQAKDKGTLPRHTTRDENLGILAELTVILSSKKNEDSAMAKMIYQHNAGFTDFVRALSTLKETLLAKYPNISVRVGHFLSAAYKLPLTDFEPQTVVAKHEGLRCLVNRLVEFDDQNLVFSLMYHHSGGEYGNAGTLVELMNKKEFLELDLPLRKLFVQALVAQMNNGVKVSREERLAFLKYVHEYRNRPTLKGALEHCYTHAPYPDLALFKTWGAHAGVDEAIYAEFDKRPFGDDGREQDNGFHLDEAQKIVAAVPAFKDKFTQDYLQLVEKIQLEAQELSTTDLIRVLKGEPKPDTVTMVMYAAEVMHRSKGRKPEEIAGKRVPGRSFELNTTQIMAVLSMLELGSKVTEEIGTGEGKSRIMMMVNACQFLRGKTVDFLTSNLALAERDYLTSLPFFTSLGAKVNFITSASRIEDYQMKDGINFSDTENLCLFRNKAKRQNCLNQVLNPIAANRALVLDEADVAYFDLSETRYEYAAKASQEKLQLLPLYPLVMSFFAESSSETLYKEDKEGCNARLISHMIRERPDLKEYIHTLSDRELERLQDAAYLVRHELHYGKSYAIVKNAVVSTPLGDKRVARALCLFDSRISKNAVFADAVHQCLHAELNRLIVAPDQIDPDLREVLNQCGASGRQFHLQPEIEAEVSSTAQTMLDDYSEGSIHAVTGTLGSQIEQAEIQARLGTTCVSIPRHKGMQRNDRPMWFAANKEKQIEALIAHIRESRAKGQPVLIVCEDDTESKELLQTIKVRLGEEQLHRIHAVTDEEDAQSEADYVKNTAGQPGQVTITTEMLGRGTDIELHGKAHDSGLKVLLTFLPKDIRRIFQDKGRAGRYGALGETQMVLDVQRLADQLGINLANRDFYRNPSLFIRKLQIFAECTLTLKRLLGETLDRFSENLNVYLAAPSEENKKTLAEYKKIREQTDDRLYKVLEGKNPDPKEIDIILQDYTRELKDLLVKQGIQLEDPLPAKITYPPVLLQWREGFDKLSAKNKQHVVIKEKVKVQVDRRWEKDAHFGHAGLVQNAEDRPLLANIKAQIENFGKVFTLIPNLRAVFSGEMSVTNYLSQIRFFAFLSQYRLFSWLKPKDEERTVKIEFTSSYGALYQAMQSSGVKTTSGEGASVAYEEEEEASEHRAHPPTPSDLGDELDPPSAEEVEPDDERSSLIPVGAPRS